MQEFQRIIIAVRVGFWGQIYSFCAGIPTKKLIVYMPWFQRRIQSSSARILRKNSLCRSRIKCIYIKLEQMISYAQSYKRMPDSCVSSKESRYNISSVYIHCIMVLACHVIISRMHGESYLNVPCIYTPHVNEWDTHPTLILLLRENNLNKGTSCK